MKPFKPLTLIGKVRFYSNYFLVKFFLLPFEVKSPRFKFYINELTYSLGKLLPYISKYKLPFSISKVTTKYGGFSIRPNTLDQICASPAFEREDVNFLLNKIQELVDEEKRILFLDIGADFGTYSITVGNRFKNYDKLKIVAFEPTKSSYTMLLENIKINNIKNIVPSLVSFETNLDSLPGFNLSDNFNFYDDIKEKNKFHYSVIINNKIEIPDIYDFRNGYYTKLGDNWYYYRIFFGIFKLKFQYEISLKRFSFNSLYLKIPFEFGGISPIGKLISSIIHLDLFLEDINIFRGCALEYNGENICIISPSFNGKTTLISSLLLKKNSTKYIAEDMLICNFTTMSVYPTPARYKNYGRSSNKNLKEVVKLTKNNTAKLKIDQLYFLQNTLNERNEPLDKNILDYFPTCSLFFLNNNFARTYISERKLFTIILEKIINISKQNNYGKSVTINNFDFTKIFN